MTNQPQQQQLPELTPEQALNALVSAARQAKLSYNDHAMIDHAARTIAQIVLPQQGQPEVVVEAAPELEVVKKPTKRGRRSSKKVEPEVTEE